jgi:ATP-dependent Clp protease ATP-binding subunit ClpX
VFIDEVDKVRAGWSGFKDVRLGVQHTLIKILEGPSRQDATGGRQQAPYAASIRFDSTNGLFICGGA